MEKLLGKLLKKCLYLILIFIVGNIPAEGFLTCSFYSQVPKIY